LSSRSFPLAKASIGSAGIWLHVLCAAWLLFVQAMLIAHCCTLRRELCAVLCAGDADRSSSVRSLDAEADVLPVPPVRFAVFCSLNDQFSQATFFSAQPECRQV
jgi:hypothetical protein